MMARKRKKGLSDRQKRILEVLEDFQNEAGYPPSIREICENANISSTSVVNYYLDQLKEMGFIERDSRVSRGIRLLRPLSTVSGIPGKATAGARAAASSVIQTAEEFGRAIGELLQIPVMGRIVAGQPVPLPPSDFNYFDAESWVDVASSQLPRRHSTPENLFALEVEGDSMIDAMVNDGDIVVMEKAQEARNGEMVAVWLTDKDETTLKYFYRENGHVRLQPANPHMEAIIIDDPSTVQVQGKVVMVIRQVQGMAS